MKNIKTKFLVALIGFILGLSAVYLSGRISSALPSETSAPVHEIAGQVKIRFVKFVRGEYDTEAEFELINVSAENVYYQGYSKESYAFPALKRDGQIVPDQRFRCGTGLSKQTLSPGESVFIRIPKWEITYEPGQNSTKKSDLPTQLGFRFIIGEHPYIMIGDQQPYETFWSEAIKFPE